MPAPGPPAHNGVLDGHRRVARQRGAPRGGLEPVGKVRLEQVDPPVRAARRRAAHVEAPASVGGADQRGPFQGLGTERLTADPRDLGEPFPVGGAGDHHGVAAAVADRTAQAVGEIVGAVDQQRARRAGPVARAVGLRDRHRHRGFEAGERDGRGGAEGGGCDRHLENFSAPVHNLAPGGAICHMSGGKGAVLVSCEDGRIRPAAPSSRCPVVVSGVFRPWPCPTFS